MAITLSDQATGTAASSTTVTAQLIGVQAGDLLTVCVAVRSDDAPSSVSDDVNGAWTILTGADIGDGSCHATIAYRENSASGTVTVTVTFGVAATSYINFARWAGALSSGALDQVNETTNASGTSHAHGSITTTTAGLIVTSAGQTVTVTDETPNASFTALTNNGNRDYFQYRITTGAVTTDGVYTSTTAHASSAVIASFKELSGGGGPTMGFIMNNLRPNAFAPGFGR